MKILNHINVDGKETQFKNINEGFLPAFKKEEDAIFHSFNEKYEIIKVTSQI